MASLREQLRNISKTPTTAEMGGSLKDRLRSISGAEKKEEEPPKEPTGVDPDIVGLQGLSAPEQAERPKTQEAQPQVPEPTFLENQEALKKEAESKQIAQVGGKGVPTSIQELYYSGTVGEQMRQKEQASRNVYSDPFATVEEIEQAQIDQREVLEYKQNIYDNIQGDNVSEVGIGKVITNPDGSTRFVPGPSSNEVTQLLLKTVSDTTRGILSLADQEEIVPRVSTQDVAVATIAEVAQLTTGAFGMLSLAGKAKKYSEIISQSPKLKAFFKRSDELGFPTGPRSKAVADTVAEYTKKFTDSTLVKGTVSSALGAAVVADDDVATLFGKPGMTEGEVKMQVLQETLLLGFALNLGKGIGEVTALTPALKFTFNKLAGATSAIMASISSKSADERVVEVLGETLLNSGNRLAKAKTPEEISQIQMEMYEELKEAYPKLSGGQTLDELLESIDVPEGGPGTAEVLGNTAIMRLQNALRTMTGSKSDANDILTNLLGQAEMRRQEALAGRVITARDELAPRGEQAGIEAEQALEADEARLLSEMEEATQQNIATVRADTEAARREAETRAQEAITAAEDAVVTTETIQLQTAENVSNNLQSSRINLHNFDDVNNMVDEDGAVTKITDVLEQDLKTKGELGNAKDTQLNTIQISGEEAQGVVDDLIGTYSNPNFLVDDEAVRSASTELSKLIRVFKSADEAVTAPSKIDLRLAEVNAQLASGAGGNQTLFLQLVDEAVDLMKRGAKMPPTKVSASSPVVEEGAEEAAEELPSITALDLEEIIRSTRKRASELSAKALELGERRPKQLADGLNQYADKLQERLDGMLAGAPVVKEAVTNFNVFFNDFKERWRNVTGKEWQGDIIGSRTRVDIAGAEDKIMKVFSNPNATKKQLQLIQEIVSKMPEQARVEFTGSIGTRILADFAKARNVLPDPTTGEFNVQQAASLLKQIDSYLSKNVAFEKALPGSFRELRNVKRRLEGVVTPALEAQKAAKTVKKGSSKAIKDAETELKRQDRQLTTQEQDAIASIQKEFDAAVKSSERSVLAKMMNQDDPTQFVQGLLTKSNGFKQYKELWERAGQVGEVGPSGLTPTQEALQETLTFATLSKVYTPTQETIGDVPTALKLITDAITRPTSTPGRMFQLAFDNNPAGKEVLEGLQLSIARYVQQNRAGTLGAIGSNTFEKQMLSRMVDDIFMVMYGPLTKDFRQARFLNRIFFGIFKGDVAVAEAFTRVLTDPRYSTRIIDKAAEIAKNSLVTEEEAFSASFMSVMAMTQGVKKYYEASDPMSELRETARSMALVQETEEGLGASPSQ